MKVAFLIRSLETGGAERQLAYLAMGLADRGVDVNIGIFYPGGSFEDELISHGVVITSLEKKGRWDVAAFLRRTLQWLRVVSPDVLHGYLPDANFVCAVLRPWLPNVKIVWGVRASDMSVVDYGWLARAVFRFSIVLSRVSNLIIVNSNSGYKYHTKMGYPSGKMRVVPNGIDTRRFYPDWALKHKQRKTWGIPVNTRVVGLVGRVDPVKDPVTFIEAVNQLSRKFKELQCVVVGDGDPSYIEELKQRAAELGLSSIIYWYPAQVDVEEVYNGLDVLISSSLSEGFSNTLLEAMACGIPCVATDVGDSADIISHMGKTVPPGDSTAMCDAVYSFLVRDLAHVDDKSAQQVKYVRENYGLEPMVKKTYHLLEKLTAGTL